MPFKTSAVYHQWVGIGQAHALRCRKPFPRPAAGSCGGPPLYAQILNKYEGVVTRMAFSVDGGRPGDGLLNIRVDSVVPGNQPEKGITDQGNGRPIGVFRDGNNPFRLGTNWQTGDRAMCWKRRVDVHHRGGLDHASGIFYGISPSSGKCGKGLFILFEVNHSGSYRLATAEDTTGCINNPGTRSLIGIRLRTLDGDR